MSESKIKVAVVTGGGHGIGRALCRRLAKDGAKVVVADIEKAAASTVAGEIGGVAAALDVGDEQATARLVEDVENTHGPIDMFISNAGVGYGDGASGAISEEGGMIPVEDRQVLAAELNALVERGVQAAAFTVWAEEAGDVEHRLDLFAEVVASFDAG